MALKHKIEKLEEVAEPLRSLYEQGNGGFFLQVEGMVPKAQLDEFRQNNITLMQERDNLKKTYEGVDVAKYRELLAAAGQTPKQIEDAVAARVEQMRNEHKTTVDDLTGKLTAANTQLDTVLVDGALRAEAVKSGVLATALDDVILRGRLTFKRSDGQLIATNEKGEKLYDTNGTDPLSVASWLKGLKKSAPHLFEGMRGAGGQGNGGQGGGNVDVSKMNATQKIAYGLNLQRQGQM